MSDWPETLSAIIAEMRAARNAASDMTLVPTEWLTQWADRIEAAAARERIEREFTHKKVEEALSDEISIRDEKIKQSAPGNAAAIRAALERLDEHLHKDDYDEHLFFDLFDYDPKEEIRTALSAPARNCDRFATAEEAVAAFADHLREWENAHGVCSEYPDHPVKVPAGAFAWLFAPAEGGAK